MTTQPAALSIAMPPWLAACAAAAGPLTDRAARMRFVVAAAARNVEFGTGGPFAAAVFECDSGRLVALGVNLVLEGGLSLLHAEMLALACAQRAVRSHDLGAAGLPAHELVTSCEPCAMCLGAIPWSGVRRVVCGARDADARAIGFDEGDKPAHWQDALRRRGIELDCDVERARAVAVLARYVELGGAVYNPAPPPPAR